MSAAALLALVGAVKALVARHKRALAITVILSGLSYTINKYFKHAIATPRLYYDFDSAQSRDIAASLPILNEPYIPTPWSFSRIIHQLLTLNGLRSPLQPPRPVVHFPTEVHL